MAYVSPNCPLPRNSQDRVTACEAARAKSVVDGMEQSVANAYKASQQIARPASFAQFGTPVVQSVQQGQAQIAAARRADIQTKPTASDVWQEVRSAPKVYPLNVSVQEYESCCDRGTDALAPVVAQPPQLIMPPRAPEVDLVRQDATPSYAPKMPVKYDAIVQYGRTPGMGAIWGDAGMRCPQVRISAGINWKATAIIGACVLGLFAATRS
jgi:hypothetical protein